MGLRDHLRRRSERERAIPEPGSAEFEAAVSGSTLSGGASEGIRWASVGGARSKEELARRAAGDFGAEATEAEVEAGPREVLDLEGTGVRDEVEEVLRSHGIDPGAKQTVDAGSVPGLQRALMAVLGAAGVRLPGPIQDFDFLGVATESDVAARLEALATARDQGRITSAEFEAQKRRLLSRA